jgi:hypothetical protein
MKSHSIFSIVSKAYVFITYDEKHVDCTNEYVNARANPKYVERCCFFAKHNDTIEIMDMPSTILSVVASSMEMSDTTNVQTMRWIYLELIDNRLVHSHYVGPWSFNQEEEQEIEDYSKLEEYAKRNGVITPEEIRILEAPKTPPEVPIPEPKMRVIRIEH